MRSFAGVLPVLIASLGCGGPPPAELASFNTVAEFRLISRTGEDFYSKAELAGRVWIADFIFTTCRGPCPRMSSWMSRIQDDLADVPNLRLVSFTVDPENDTPEVMAEYAERYRARPDRWFLLTGEQETLHHLKREAFLLGDVDLSLNHSTRFVLVDQHGVIRGYYRSSETESMEQLMADARRLARDS